MVQFRLNIEMPEGTSADQLSQTIAALASNLHGVSAVMAPGVTGVIHSWPDRQAVGHFVVTENASSLLAADIT